RKRRVGRASRSTLALGITTRTRALRRARARLQRRLRRTLPRAPAPLLRPAPRRLRPAAARGVGSHGTQHERTRPPPPRARHAPQRAAEHSTLRRNIAGLVQPAARPPRLSKRPKQGRRPEVV